MRLATQQQVVYFVIFTSFLVMIPLGTFFLADHFKTGSPGDKLGANSLTNKDDAFAKSITSEKPTASATASLDLGEPELTSLPQISVGPTLSLKVQLEGRPAADQSTKLFIGIAKGAAADKPTYLFSVVIDLPAAGESQNVSLAGLEEGQTYTAYLKGQAQLASATTFTLSPITNNLNNGESIVLTTGDLNEDNFIDKADLGIAQKALGSTPGTPQWNELVDFNKDGRVNSLDLSIIYRNLNKTGVSGAWYSPTPTGMQQFGGPEDTTPSASPLQPEQTIKEEENGYWFWVPKTN